MKTTTKAILGFGAVAALSTAAFTGVALTDDDVAGGPRGPQRMHMQMERGEGPHGPMQRAHFTRHMGRGHARFGEEMLELYDTNKDGKLTQAEIDTARADRLAKFDTDKDGKLNLQEYQALWLDAMHERMVRAFQAHDSDGDGQVTVAEFQKRFKDIVARLDRNDDGAYSKDDQAKAREEFRHHHEGPHGREL